MIFDSIEDIYSANDEIHAALKSLVSTISEDTAQTSIANEKWTIAEIVEHIAIVDEGASKICAKLLGNAQTAAASSARSASVSDNFLKHYATINDVKLVAPDRVQPIGVVPIAESVARMDQNRARLYELRSRFESLNSDATFPHPYFGQMTAVEWLILIGGHEKRHTEQICRLLEQVTHLKK